MALLGDDSVDCLLASAGKAAQEKRGESVTGSRRFYDHELSSLGKRKARQ